MKPHPRIRKTIKWGGAAVTVLLVVVWVGSGWLIHGFFVGNVHFAMLAHGRAVVTRTAWDMRDQMEPVMRAANGRQPFRLDWTAALKGRDRTTDWQIVVPLWSVSIASGLVTTMAWRLDTLARRRAQLNLCPKCNYDRAGLGGGAGAVCPECGAKPVVASEPTKSTPHA